MTTVNDQLFDLLDLLKEIAAYHHDDSGLGSNYSAAEGRVAGSGAEETEYADPTGDAVVRGDTSVNNELRRQLKIALTALTAAAVAARRTGPPSEPRPALNDEERQELIAENQELRDQQRGTK